jgi:hypothetical protein
MTTTTLSTTGLPAISAPTRVFATLISYIFHPIFLVPLMGAFLIYGVPGLYTGLDTHVKNFILLRLVANALFFPLLGILLTRALKLVSSLTMEDRKDRIIPYVITLTCYFWTWRVMQYQQFPTDPMTAMIFGAFLSTSMALVLNSFYKISMHAIGVGGLVMFMLLLGWQGAEGIGIPLALSILIAGLVCSARLAISDHSNKEILFGLAIGVVGQALGFVFFHGA